MLRQTQKILASQDDEKYAASIALSHFHFVRISEQTFSLIMHILECPSGHYWINCSKICPFPQYGDHCRQQCFCEEKLCDFITGCIKGKYKQIGR